MSIINSATTYIKRALPTIRHGIPKMKSISPIDIDIKKLMREKNIIKLEKMKSDFEKLAASKKKNQVDCIKPF